MTEPTTEADYHTHRQRRGEEQRCDLCIAKGKAEARASEHELLELQGNAYEAEIAEARASLDVDVLARALYRTGVTAPEHHRGTGEWYSAVSDTIAGEYRAILVETQP